MAVDNKVIANPLTANTDLVTITESAVVQLRELIRKQEGAGPELGLRVFVFPGGCSGISFGMAFEDQPAEDDMIINISGLKLYLDEMSSSVVAGTIIDYDDRLMGGSFRIMNPNVVSSCNCG
jgi:iron-sulfur cluster assembly protein